MSAKKIVRISVWALNFFIIFLLIWSIINYKFLNHEVSQIVQVWGVLAMVFFSIILEGAPVFVGPSVAVAAVLAMGTANPWLILFLFLFSALAGNVIYYYLGYFFGESVLNYFDKNGVKRYKKLFRKYGKTALIIMAVSPIPYFPTIPGVFRVKSPYLIMQVLIARMLRHTAVFFFWYSALIGF